MEKAKAPPAQSSLVEMIAKTIKEAQDWADFLAGHWQKEMPTAPGSYPLATSYGDVDVGERGNVYLDPDTGKARSVRPWSGFWWSKPFPKMPELPPDLRG